MVEKVYREYNDGKIDRNKTKKNITFEQQKKKFEKT